MRRPGSAGTRGTDSNFPPLTVRAMARWNTRVVLLLYLLSLQPGQRHAIIASSTQHVLSQNYLLKRMPGHAGTDECVRPFIMLEGGMCHRCQKMLQTPNGCPGMCACRSVHEATLCGIDGCHRCFLQGPVCERDGCHICLFQGPVRGKNGCLEGLGKP